MSQTRLVTCLLRVHPSDNGRDDAVIRKARAAGTSKLGRDFSSIPKPSVFNSLSNVGKRGGCGGYAARDIHSLAKVFWGRDPVAEGFSGDRHQPPVHQP